MTILKTIDPVKGKVAIPQGYRLLKPGTIIEATDLCTRISTDTWEPTKNAGNAISPGTLVRYIRPS